MAAPCKAMAGRLLLQYMSRFNRAALKNTGFRQFSGSSLCRVGAQAAIVTDRANSPWTLMAAVCLQRLPVIAAELSPIEQRFNQMIQQIELERSLMSDHELRLLGDAARLSRKQSDDYDSDEDEDDDRGQDIVLGQDMEDIWEQQLKKFEPEPRVRADVDQDLSSAQRCLAHRLILLAQQQVGDEKLWLFPQTEWQSGETMRQTAERALASLPAAGFSATFLSHAPCGVYKYKLPRALRTDSRVGAKVFFFKALLSGSAPPSSGTSNGPFMWLKRSELPDHLKPAYMSKVQRFLLDL